MAPLGVRELYEVAAVRELRVRGELRAVLDRAPWYAPRLQQPLALEHVALACELGDDRVERRTVLEAPLEIRKARVISERRLLEDVTKGAPMLVCLHGDRHPEILARSGVHAVRCEVQIGVADAAGQSSVCGVVEDEGGQEVQRGFQLRQVDELALARTSSMLEGRENRDRVVAGRDVVGVRAKRTGWVPNGPAGELVEARDGRGEIAVPGESRERARLTHQTCREHDQVGLELAQLLVAQAERSHDSG